MEKFGNKVIIKHMGDTKENVYSNNSSHNDIFSILQKFKNQGKTGEAIVSKILEKVTGYKKIINNIMINDNGKSRQIDHILICSKGVFVIETKNYAGQIYGKEDSDEWKQYLNGKVYNFKNPIFQNYGHKKIIEKTLKDEKILSQTAEKDGDNSEMPESKDIVQSTEESAAHISNDKVGTTNKKVVEMKDIVYVDELIQLLESNSDINFIKNGSYWEYKNGDTLIRIRDADKVENVFWKNYK